MNLKRSVILAAGLLLLNAAAWAHPSPDYSEVRIFGSTSGNHDLSCTVIRPWGLDGAPNLEFVPYPVIGWLNGWDQGNVVGQTTLRGYLPGLIQWAIDLQMIVIAANQWSARDVDMIRCLEWLAQENATEGSVYFGLIDVQRIGIVGHSQGGGGVLKVGANSSPDYTVSTVVAMNPYGPNWAGVGSQEGPVLMIGGGNDTTTPTSSFLPAWELIAANGIGGLLVEKPDGTHNGDAWAPADDFDNPQNYNFGDYQEIVRLWWRIFLENADESDALLAELVSRGFVVLDCAELTFCP